MFTGLVQDVGAVVDVADNDDGARVTLRSRLAADLRLGDSIAVAGVCLTATEVDADAGVFSADVMPETLRLTAGALVGQRRNLELALRAADRLGGHLVSGHVDGVGRVCDVRADGFARVLEIDVPAALARYVVAKGSITIDGVSLTVVAADAERFSVSLIPETVERTTLGGLRPGDTVNLEVDMLAKYVERMVGQ